jgi:hypothetical protein
MKLRAAAGVCLLLVASIYGGGIQAAGKSKPAKKPRPKITTTAKQPTKNVRFVNVCDVMSRIVLTDLIPGQTPGPIAFYPNQLTDEEGAWRNVDLAAERAERVSTCESVFQGGTEDSISLGQAHVPITMFLSQGKYTRETINGITYPTWIRRLGKEDIAQKSGPAKGLSPSPKCAVIVDSPLGTFSSNWINSNGTTQKASDVSCSIAIEFLKRAFVVLSAGGYSYLPGS